MDINTEAQQGLLYPNPTSRFNEKGCLPVWGGDALSARGKRKLLSMTTSNNKDVQENAQLSMLTSNNKHVL